MSSTTRDIASAVPMMPASTPARSPGAEGPLALDARGLPLLPGHNAPVDLVPPRVPGAPVPAPLQDPNVARSYHVVRDRAGDASSVLSMVGCAMLLSHDPAMLKSARGVIGASLAAGALDTAVQGARWAAGKQDAGFEQTAYAATGLLPASSLMWGSMLRGGVHRSELPYVVALAANVGLIGYEAMERSDAVLGGTEDVSGYLAIGAAVSGVVARAH